MAILWSGGEDIDFPLGVVTSLSFNTGFTNLYRSNYCRGWLMNAANRAWSDAFAGGGVTSCWFACQMITQWQSQSGPWAADRFVGLGNVASNSGSGLVLASGTTNGSCLAIGTWNGSTYTKLVEGTIGLFTPNINQSYRIDLQVIGFGGSCTLNVYVNGGLYMTWSGSTSGSGVSTLDCVVLHSGHSGGGGSEFIVADSDTRNMGLMTLSPNGNGTADTWSGGTYVNLSSTTLSDTTPAYTNATGQDEQFALSDLVAGNFTVLAVKVAVRACSPSGSTATQLALGVVSGGTTSVGSPIALGAVYTTYERLMAQNPATSADWAQSAMNSLQLAMRSA